MYSTTALPVPYGPPVFSVKESIKSPSSVTLLIV
jgi:hypothetical protein